MTVLIHEITSENIIDIVTKTPAENRVFLDSSCPNHPFSQFSFLMISPLFVRTIQANDTQAIWQQLHHDLKILPSLEPQINLPFLGGLCGLLPYELGKTRHNSTTPIVYGIYDLVFCQDHKNNKLHLISNGLTYRNNSWALCTHEARNRLNLALSWLNKPNRKYQQIEPPLNFISHHLDSLYLNDIKKIKEYIRNGDIFQANLTSKYSAKADKVNTENLYLNIRQHTKAPFSALLEFDEISILSASPERFIKLQNNQVTTCPIKGTSARLTDPTQDQKNKDYLLQSKKERAENVMIVDLMRNDLSKVCEPGSVKVPNLCQLQTFGAVYHLVSTVTGILKENHNAIDLLQATVPGGSITGAPKKRAMEIIEETEKTARGAYCGNIFYISLCGSCDSSILIRTLIKSDGMIHIHAGSGITLLSHESDELNEKKIKLNSFAGKIGQL